MIKNYRDLKVWQKSIGLTNKIYNLTKSFPSEEKYGLTSQLSRASISVASNIAEGSVKQSKKEFARFVNIAYGSLAEVDTQLVIAVMQKYIDENEIDNLKIELNEIAKMLNGLRKSLNEN